MQVSFILNWFTKVYESIIRLKIASGESDTKGPWEDYFNGMTGLLLKNDKDKNNLLPYNLFRHFLASIGAIDYSEDFKNTRFEDITIHNGIATEIIK